jgi:uncharacterized protein
MALSAPKPLLSPRTLCFHDSSIPMTESGRKRCVVAYATRERQYLWAVDVSADATIADAIEAARQLADEPDVPWETAAVGIFGEPRERSDRPAEGDRIELYRPLPNDPRDRRRERVQKQRKSGVK